MHFDILTLFPDFFSSILENSITGKAIKKGILSFNYINIRDFANDKHNRVDDYPYSGGEGMLIRPQPVFNAYNSILKTSEKRPVTIYMSPRGKKFNQEIATKLAKENHIVLICGHYEGIDQRIIDEICDYELSIGDYVLTGGEIPALTVCDAVSRLVPGVLSSAESYENESHYNGLLEYSQYTRPPVFNGINVPEILLSGDNVKIEKWKYENSVEITKINRPDLFEIKFNTPINKVIKETIPLNILILTDNSNQKQFVASEIDMQLSKRNLTSNFIENIYEVKKTDNLIVLVCGNNDFDFSDIINHKKALIYLLREKDITNIELTETNLSAFENQSKSICTCTVSELANHIEKYELSLKIYDMFINGSSIKDIFTDSSEIKFLKPLPYDAYENNLLKFKKYTINDLYLIDDFDLKQSEFYTLIIDNKAYSAEIFQVKIKNTGKKYCLAVKNIEKIYLSAPNSKFYIVSSDVQDSYNLINTFNS